MPHERFLGSRPTWTAATNGINFGTYGLRIQISLVGDPAVFDRSTETFTVPENTTTFYVNDDSTVGDQYTTAPGSNRNDGRLPSAPIPYINNILRIYSLGPGDTLYVDTGNYVELGPVVLSSIVGVGDDRGFTLTGPTDPGTAAVLSFANPLTVAPLIELDSTGSTTIEHLTLMGGQYGIYSFNNSMGLTAENLTVESSSQDGIRVDTGSSVQDLGSSAITRSARYGINVNGPVVTLHDNVVAGNGNTGIYLVNPGNATVLGNDVAGNLGAGIYVSNDVSGTTAVIGAAPGQGNGNTVSGNSGDGIDAYGSVLVVGNAVTGATGPREYGIYLWNASASENVVYGNTTGIREAQPGGFVDQNRVYDNSGAGIIVDFAAAVLENVVYSNLLGIETTNYYGGQIANNLIYANLNQGVLIESPQTSGIQFTNNTVYQPTGDGVDVDNNTIDAEIGNAVQVDGGTVNAHLLNNILWAQSGYDVSVAADSEVGFQSDYNDLYTSGGGSLGLWEGRTFTTLVDWFYELGLDSHSITTDPQFVDAAGADGVTGFSSAPVGAPVVIDDSSASGFSLTGSWTHQTNGGYQKEYLTAPAGAGNDTATWTFSGLTPGATYEIAATWPNGYQYTGDAPYTVLDGGTVVGYRRVSQYYAPSGISYGGSIFETFGFFQVSSTTLTVMLSNNAGATVEADAVLLQQIVGDHGADDDFQLQTSSPAVDAGDPDSYYFQEPAPNGGRIDLGAFGNTADATPSPAQLVQILSPSGLEKYQVGQQVTIDWQTSGLTEQGPVALVDAGGNGVDNFGPDQFQTSSGTSDLTFNNAVDTSGVTNPAPQAVYQSYAQAAYGVGNTLSYHLSVPNGVYTIRLDFVEPNQSVTAGGRVFDIDLQGTTVQQGYDIVADAGAAFKATAKTYTVTASRGQGINLSLVNDTATPAVLSGLEVFAANAGGVANPTVNLQVSTDGGTTWTTIATGLTMDAFGRGSYVWTVPTTETPGNDYLIRAIANEGTDPQGVSNQPFLVASAGKDFYVNDGSTSGDVYTTAPGNNANSGTSTD